MEQTSQYKWYNSLNNDPIHVVYVDPEPKKIEMVPTGIMALCAGVMIIGFFVILWVFAGDR